MKRLTYTGGEALVQFGGQAGKWTDLEQMVNLIWADGVGGMVQFGQ